MVQVPHENILLHYPAKLHCLIDTDLCFLGIQRKNAIQESFKPLPLAVCTKGSAVLEQQHAQAKLLSLGRQVTSCRLKVPLSFLWCLNHKNVFNLNFARAELKPVTLDQFCCVTEEVV